jgi:sulfide:quinone oxidoreductase
MRTNVLIAGGGPAALEASLALHRLAGARVATTLLAPESTLTYRPLSVLSPFAAGGAPDYPLAQMAADAGFTHRRGRLAAVDPVAHTVTTAAAEQLSYDLLLVASGARHVEPFPRATAFTGSITDQERLHGIVQDVEGGYLRRLAFVVPAGSTWPLPLYELALMLAERADSMGVDPVLHFVTPEPAPLALFGAAASTEVASMLSEARIRLHSSVHAEVVAPGRIRLAPGSETLEVDRIVTLPRLQGPSIPGLPADAEGFLVTDSHARVVGVPDVYAAGDVTAFPVKQGGIACQQADAAAAHIAARAGAPISPKPFSPVLRGMLLTERSARFMRREAGGTGDAAEVAGRALWWPPTKIAGRELAGYLEGLDEAANRPSGRPINIDVGNAGSGEIEVLSLH